MKNNHREARRIWKNMICRWEELWNRIEQGNINKATPYAFEFGFVADIEQALDRKKAKKE